MGQLGLVHGRAFPAPQSGCSNSSLPHISNISAQKKAPSLPPVSFLLRLCLELAQTLPRITLAPLPAVGVRAPARGRGRLGSHSFVWHTLVTSGTSLAPRLQGSPSHFQLFPPLWLTSVPQRALEAPRVFLARPPVERGTHRARKVPNKSGEFSSLCCFLWEDMKVQQRG